MEKSSMKKCLITGGAGFLGINLIRYLLEKGWSITSLDIADFVFSDVADNITILKGDIRDREFVNAAMQGIDIVIHTAAALPLMSKDDIYSTEVDGTRIILEAAFKHNIERVVHISSTAVYGIPDHHPLREEDKMHGVGAYGEAKILAEEVCHEYRKKGMCIPILRPKSFVGPERLGVFALLFEWANEGKNFPLLGNGKNLYQLLDVEDLCQAIYSAATGEREKVNDTFNVGAKVFNSLADDFQAVLDYAGHGKKIRNFPARPVIVALKILEKLKLSPLYEWIYETASTESFVSIEKAEMQLGYKPQFSNTDALLRNYKWYRENLWRFKNKSGTSHTVPWSQGALRLAKVFF
jgi:nucleoside-diphosphate-sugar epimerase